MVRKLSFQVSVTLSSKTKAAAQAVTQNRRPVAVSARRVVTFKTGQKFRQSRERLFEA